MVGEPVELLPGLLRLTAPNPGLMTGPGTNTYLLGRSEVAVIDPGPVGDDGHLDAIERAVPPGARIRWVLVTHHHPDHAPAAPALCERSGAPLLAFGHAEGVDPDVAVGDGFELRGPDFTLRALHTPGHASDHVCWLLGEHSMLFSGDHVMQGSTVVVRPPDGDMAVYLASLERLLGLSPPLESIAPGHGRLIAEPAGVIRSIIDHRLARERRVLAALGESGASSVDELLPLVYDDVDDQRVPVARHSLRAHLDKLVAEGRVRVLGDLVPPEGDEARFESIAR